MSLIDEIRNDVAGAELLADWLGHGAEPVAQEVAEHRAGVCLAGDHGNPCPHNVEPRWWERFKGKIADAIRAELELKARVKLRVPQEESLAMCRCCGCPLPLKIWTPAQHLKAHTSEAVLARTPLYCWMRRELSVG